MRRRRLRVRSFVACSAYRSRIRTDIPARPEAWSEICGWYSPDPGPVTNLFTRALMGAGAEVTVRHGHLTLKPLHPIPAIRRGMRLHPDDPNDPWAFQVEMPEYGISLRVVFSQSPEKGRTTTRLLTDTFSLQKGPMRETRDWSTPRYSPALRRLSSTNAAKENVSGL